MNYDAIGTAAAESENQSVEKSVTRELPVAGPALLRLKSYVELGRHTGKTANAKPAQKTILVFELLHPLHMAEMQDGTKRPMLLTVRVNKTASSMGRFLPLFNKMNYNGDKTHMIQMLGQSFLGEIFHNVSDDGKNTYVNLDNAGAWVIGKPEVVNPITRETTVVPVPQMHGKVSGFLWENETISDEQIKGMWADIFIEGEWERDGKKTSKNWLQETIIASMDYKGSRTQSVVEEQVDVDELTA